MANIHTSPMEFHEGEQKVQSLLHVPQFDNPTTPGLSPYAAHLLRLSSLLALGTLDKEGRPWTTLLGGQPGFARSLGQSFFGVKTLVDGEYDPVLQLLIGGTHDGEVREVANGGKLVSALGIHLESRDRVKLGGRLVAGALEDSKARKEGKEDAAAEVQMVFAVQQSLGNCPKYLNKKRIVAATPRPVLVHDSLPLCDSALKLILASDMFFISASNHGSTMSTNHRGGPPGFARVVRNDGSGVTLIYPELSGNRLYQTLGNLYTTPKAGLVFPDFDSGDVLYVSGTTEILIGRDAATMLPRSNLAVKINVDAARFVKNGFAFRGESGERSPYNPPIRYLLTERALRDTQINDNRVVYARLLARDVLTPTIARFRFSVIDPETAGRWKPGQYVALAFEDELSIGYSHMRDDDPRSLNDDYVRTFTISSSPGGNLPNDEFEITIRNVGIATSFLFRQNIRAQLEIPLRGFGGSFSITQGPNEVVPFIAGGIGITPLLAQLPGLDPKRLRLFWTVNVHDIGLVLDSIEAHPALAPSTLMFLSGLSEMSSVEAKSRCEKLERLGCELETRRMIASDVKGHTSLSSTWYLCTGPSLRKSLLVWLSDKKTIYEDFDY